MPPKRQTQTQKQSQSQSQWANHTQRTIDTTRSDMDDDEDESVNESFAVENDGLFKQMVCASVQYILIHSSKPQTIKKSDWINTVLRPLTNEGRKYFPQVHKAVVKALQNTFGYRLVPNEKQDAYILVNDLKKGPLEQRPLVNPSHYSKYALLMIIVTCLKRAGGEMTSIDFWAILAETFSIRHDETTRSTINQHKIFGDVHKLIKTDFVKDGYLIFEQAKEVTSETSPQTVKLGLRAMHEFPDHALEEFMEKIRDYAIESDHDPMEEEEVDGQENNTME